MSREVAIKDICDVFDGPHATPKRTETGPVYLGIKAISVDGTLLPNEFTYLSKADYKKWTKRVTPQENDIVFSYEATLGRYAIIPKGFYGCLGRRLAVLRAKNDDINIKWLYYYFKSPKWITHIANNTVYGSTVLRISIDDFPFFPVLLPNRLEQDKIAAVLDVIDRKITLNNSINAELKKTAKLLYDYWFVQFDFPNAEGKPYRASGGEMIFNEQLKRDVPKGWPVKPLGDVLGDVESGKRPQGGAVQSGIPSIGAENIEAFGVYNYSKEKYISPSYFARMRSGIVKSGDVLLYKDGAYAGKASMALDGFPHPQCAVNEHVFILRFSDELPSQFFLYLFLRRPENYSKLNSIASSKAAQPGLNQDELNSVYVVVPPKEIVRLFNQCVEPMMHKISSGANQSVELTALRNFLLPLLMNGQVRVCG